MKTAIYDPVKKSLVSVLEAYFHHRETNTVALGVVQSATKVLGNPPGFAFCVFDSESLRVFPFNMSKPPSFDEVERAAALHGYTRSS
jgi:hypothetical protein